MLSLLIGPIVITKMLINFTLYWASCNYLYFHFSEKKIYCYLVVKKVIMKKKLKSYSSNTNCIIRQAQDRYLSLQNCLYTSFITRRGKKLAHQKIKSYILYFARILLFTLNVEKT